MSIFKSRKFWIMVANTVVSSATFLVTNYVQPSLNVPILFLIATWQPVIIALINGIATEDAAMIAASAPVPPSAPVPQA